MTKVISTGALEASVSRFDSCLLDKNKNGGVVQLEDASQECSSVTGEVVGSSPIITAKCRMKVKYIDNTVTDKRN